MHTIKAILGFLLAVIIRSIKEKIPTKMRMMMWLELKKSQIENKIDQGNVENCRDQIKCFMELLTGTSPTLSKLLAAASKLAPH